MRVCELLFPEVSFEALTPGMTVDQQADNINAIIDYIEEIAPEIDISDLNGYMICTGDLPSIYTFLNLIHQLIIVTLEEEEEEDEEAQELKRQQEAELQKQKEKERELQEKQLLEEPSALPVGNIRDLLRKKKKNTEILQSNDPAPQVAAATQPPTQTSNTASAKKNKPSPKPKKEQPVSKTSAKKENRDVYEGKYCLN